MTADPLADLRILTDGWDSYGGKAPTKAALDAAGRVRFVPTSDGGVQIELHAPLAWAEIGIDPGGEITHASWGPV